MNTLVSLLKKNPEVLSKYVSFGTAMVDTIVAPLNKFMEHLLTIQGIDPATQPGQSFHNSLNNLFNEVGDIEDFGEDYDDKVMKKHFAKAQGKLKHLNLTLNQYKEMTDITDLKDKEVLPQVTIPDPLDSIAPYYTVEDQKKFAELDLLTKKSPPHTLDSLMKILKKVESVLEEKSIIDDLRILDFETRLKPVSEYAKPPTKEFLGTFCPIRDSLPDTGKGVTIIVPNSTIGKRVESEIKTEK
jgi:hypothetical protein